MRTEAEGSRVTVYPEGRISADNAADFQEELGKAYAAAEKELVIDARNLSYVSSAGLRVLLHFARKKDKKLLICNVGQELYDIFHVTGFTELLNIKRKMRSISIEGCEVIGRGAVGTVYRIDAETIVKVFAPSTRLEDISAEQEKARKAFVKGIPTAIPYDIVQVGEQYGAVFELLDAHNLNDIYRQNPENSDALISRHVALMHQVHAAEALPGELPAARDVFLRYVEELSGTIPAETAEKIRQLLQRMPDDLHIVHGDLQMKNVMLNRDEMILIDMDTLCTGNPVFDLQALYVAYQSFNEDQEDNGMQFLGIPNAQCDIIWKQLAEHYFEGFSPEKIRQMEDRIRVLACVRFLDRIVTAGLGRPDLREIRVRHTLEHLEELLPRVEELTV